MPSVTGSGSTAGAAFRAALAAVSLGKARPSYDRKSPLAQYRQLQRTESGRRALNLAGIAVTGGTSRRWLRHQQSPSKANAERISRAYEAARSGGIPAWVKAGSMDVTGMIATGDDVRDRTLHIDLANVTDTGGGFVREDRRGHWQAIEEDWPTADDDDLEELLAEDLIAEDIGDASGGWGFPGGGYSVTFTG